MAINDPNTPATLKNVLASRLDVSNPRYKKNAAAMAALTTRIADESNVIQQGGGPKAIESQHSKNRLTARERLNLLIDPGTEFFELSLFAAHGMYEEWGGAPAAGTLTGLGRVAGKLCMIIANDATVKAGAFFPMTAKKVIRAQTIAIENRIPTIYLVDSAGVFLPLQEDVFPDQDDFGRIFRNNAVMSAMGIPQITAIMGMCVAGGAYLPVMTDTVLMTEGSGLFLAGPALVQAAIGQKYTAEELGGATMHAEISGTVDFKEPNDHLCLARLRSLVGRIGQRPSAPFDRAPFDEKKDAPKYPLKTSTRSSIQTPRPTPTTCTKSSPASPTAASSTNTAPTTDAPSSAATRASAASPSASSPTRNNISRRPRIPEKSAPSSAESSTPRAPKRPLASSWTATRASSR